MKVNYQWQFEKMTEVTGNLRTNLRGLQIWMQAHPKKKLDGYFSYDGKELSHEQVKRVVDYAVGKGYLTDGDIPSEELEKIIESSVQ